MKTARTTHVAVESLTKGCGPYTHIHTITHTRMRGCQSRKPANEIAITLSDIHIVCVGIDLGIDVSVSIYTTIIFSIMIVMFNLIVVITTAMLIVNLLLLFCACVISYSCGMCPGLQPRSRLQSEACRARLIETELHGAPHLRRRSPSLASRAVKRIF